MYKRCFVTVALLLALAACGREEASPGGETPQNPATAADTTEAARSAPARRVAGALKSPLPEGFELPFGFHRLYDNTGTTESGAPQRRILVEYLDIEAAQVQSDLSAGLASKGFSAGTPTQNGATVEVVFTRDDGANVVVKVTPGREAPRAPNAKGLLHLSWNEG